MLLMLLDTAALLHRKLRIFLSILSIALAFVVFGLLGSFQEALDRRLGLQTDRYVTQSRIGIGQTLAYSAFQTVVGAPGVSQATHVNWFGGYIGDPRSQVATLAVDPASYLSLYDDTLDISPTVKAEFLRVKSAALVDPAVAMRFGWKVGDRIRISSNIFLNVAGGNTWDFDLVGLIQPRKAGIDTNFILVGYDYFNETRTFGKDRVNYVISRPTVDTDRDSYAQHLDQLFDGDENPTSTSTEQAFSRAFLAQFGQIGFVTLLIGSATFAVTLLIVGSSMAMTIRERTPEIGLLLTLGFARGAVFRLVVGESVLIALIGGLTGLLGAALGTRILNAPLAVVGLDLAISWKIVAIGVALMAGLGVVTGLLPAWAASRLRIVEALRGR